MTTNELIEKNQNAPADRLITAIYLNCTDIRDAEDGTPLPSLREALNLWYDVDDLVLSFQIPGGRRTFVRLIHQETMDKPCMEDISDYGMSVEQCEPLAALLKELGCA